MPPGDSEPSLRRTLTTRDITLFAIACIVGPRWIATAARAGPGAILLWVVGALCFSIPLAIAVAALTIRHPHAGGIPLLPPIVALLIFAAAVGQFGGLGSSVSRMPFAAGVDGLMPRAFGKIHPRWNTPHISILTLGILATTLLIAIQIGDTARAACDTLVSLMVIVGFIPFIYIFGSAWKAGHPWAAASGWGVTLLAILCALVPPGGVTHAWIFEGKLGIGTAAGIISAWVVYRRSTADNSSKVVSPG